MKRFLLLPLIIMATTLFTQCSPDKTTDPVPDPGNGNGNGGGKGAPQAKGTPNGTVFSKKIGAAGGTIEYPGARLTLIIPAGAVENETEFFIQPITNTTPGGKGLAYRLQPEALTFKKPATLKIKYTEEDLNGTMATALGIATQKADGVWYAQGALHKEADKTIEVKTTHFSDWSFFEAIAIEPAHRFLDPGQQITLAIKYTLPGSNDEDILLAPLTKEGYEAALTDPKTLLDAKFVSGWTLQGSGTLTGTGNTAKYTAPVKAPATNPAMVIANIKSKGKAIGMVMSRLFTIPEGISVSIAGGEYTTYGNSGGHITTGQSFVMAEQNGTTVSLKWNGEDKGKFYWDATNILFLLNIGASKTYAQVYNAGGNAVPSPGELEIMSATGTGDFIIGTFQLSKAGYFQTSTPPVVGTTSIKGYFKVKQLN